MRPALFTLAASLAFAQAGCSLLGLQPPRYKLLDEAKAFRESTYPPAVPKELAKQPLAPFVVEPGDGLLVQVTQAEPGDRTTFDAPVLPDGVIELGKYGRPLVAGRTLPEIDGIVRQAVQAGEKEPVTVTVRLVGRQSKVFYVLGEVNAPGAYPLSGRETVLDGIMVAGGVTRQGDYNQIIVSRPTPPDGCRVVLPVCYNQIVQLGDTSSNYQLQPGDRIFVPSTGLLDGLLPSRKRNGCGPCAKPHVPCVGGCLPAASGIPLAPVAVPVPGAAP
jgi:protein involved in polysaccharide export with SLBB domain